MAAGVPAVWRAAVKTGDGSWEPGSDELEAYLAQIRLFNSDEECKKIERYRFARDQKASIVGRLLIRRFVKECGILTAGKLPIKRVHGKPYLARSEEQKQGWHLDFNLSHAGAWTIFVGCYFPCCPDRTPFAISCDTMPIAIKGRNKDQDQFFSTLQNTLTSREWARIRQEGLTDRETLTRFYEHWTLKESFIKAVSVGLAMPLEDLEFTKPEEDDFMKRLRPDVIDTSAKVRVKGDEQNQWSFEQHWLDEDHVAAVATCPLSEVDKEYAAAAYSAAAVASSTPKSYDVRLQPAPFLVLQPSDLLEV